MQGLVAIHAAGVIHKDINPHNIVVYPSSPSNLNIIDFSIASQRVIDSESPVTNPQQIQVLIKIITLNNNSLVNRNNKNNEIK